MYAIIFDICCNYDTSANLHLIIIIFGKAIALPQRNMSEFSVDPSLQYPYPVQWLFEIFTFKCMIVQDMTRGIARPTTMVGPVSYVGHYKSYLSFWSD